ncbi:double-stranded RNA-binding protein 4 isoform X3 [Medicago truncatula]|uniref:Double-stranded RNA-binding motif protein n=1 Tax=Medicago truncatula TaxID=3880 RepID=A0A072U7D1_MEDTR|nr:double-stranded RNA-binding protein 4 isoform X3 [Medicago truncatula]KEH25587.1 double-stranded RNA-binding motif protein [Medicago truncatula]
MKSSQNNPEESPFLPNFDSYPQPCLPASKFVQLSQDSAPISASNGFSLQNPIPPPLHPNLSSFPQPSLPDSSIFSFSRGSPVLSPEVGSTLPTNQVFQPNSEPVCQTIQISSPVAAVTDVVKEQELKSMMHLYKSQLQNYAQKRNLKLPEYAPEWEGPPHNMRFRCKVTIDGQTFESPRFYSTLRDAEYAAAEVAFKSLQPAGVQEEGILMYKNLLQELIQKGGLLQLPVYSTTKSGEAHRPTFTSQVEIEGKVYTGEESKTKKQAEMSAAKVAYTTLKELKAHGGQSPELFPNGSKSNVVIGLQHHSSGESSDRSKANVILGLQHHSAGGSSDHSRANVITGMQHHSAGGFPANPGPVIQNPHNTGLQHHSAGGFPANPGPVIQNPHNSGLQHHSAGGLPANPGPVIQNPHNKVEEKLSSSGNKNDCSKVSFPSNPRAIPTSVSDSNNVDIGTNNVSSTSVGTPPGRMRVRVYSRKTNVEIAPGGTLMPCSDDKYVAYSYSE